MSQLTLSELLVRMTNVVSAELRAAASSHDLRTVQLQALLYLARCNRYGDTPIALAEFLGLTKGTVSQTLNTLEKKELISKTPDPDDGRVVRLALTAKGRRIVKASPALGFGLDPSDEEALKDGLIELLAAAQRARGGRSFGVCATCRHLQTTGSGFRCGLTNERLSQIATTKICREHFAKEPA